MENKARPMFFAVRRSTEGHEWIDTSTASRGRDGSVNKHRSADREVPGWAAANPVVRIGTFAVTEIK